MSTLKQFTLFFLVVTLLGSCAKETQLEETEIESQDYELLKEVNGAELMQVQMELEKTGTDLGELVLEESDLEERASTLFLNIYKVSVPTPHPDGSGRTIQNSGVVIVPKWKWSKYRILYNPPFTYVNDAAAPSNFYENIFWNSLSEIEGSLNYAALLQAHKGFAVFLPDYPGFGDSNGDCQHPYVNKDAHNQSNYDFLVGGINLLKRKGYRIKSDILIQGYSQGAYSSMQLARYLETETSIGVKAVAAGGTPAYLDQLVSIAKSEESLPFPWFFPYASLGWYDNNLTDINIQELIQEPYASEAPEYYDGSKSLIEVSGAFPSEVGDFMTSAFISSDLFNPTDPLYEIGELARANSVIPWDNRAPIRMYHGVSDNGVFYEQARNYYEDHKAQYGNISFDSTLGEHIIGFLPFYAKSSIWLNNYK